MFTIRAAKENFLKLEWKVWFSSLYLLPLVADVLRFNSGATIHLVCIQSK